MARVSISATGGCIDAPRMCATHRASDVWRATTARDETARRGLLGMPAPRWCAFVTAGLLANRNRRRVALSTVASSGLRPSRAFSKRLRLQPTVPAFRGLDAAALGRTA